MYKIFIINILTLICLNLAGQINRYGVPLVRNYSAKTTGGSEQFWCITEDKFGNLYFGSQDRGVTKYDGTKWTSVNIGQNPRIYSLETDDNGILYVGAAFEFGYIQPGLKGDPEYVSLSSRLDNISDIRFVYSIVVHEGKVLFLSPKVLYSYDPEKDLLTSRDLLKSGILDAFRLVKAGDQLILSDILQGLYVLKDTALVPAPGGSFFKNMSCTVFLPYDDRKVVIGTFDDGLYLYDAKTGEVRSDFVDPSMNRIFREVFIYAGARISDSLFAIGTTNREGILIINREGKLIQKINTGNSEMEDNTAYAMYCNYNTGSELWISSFGTLSKAYVNIPLTVFSEKQGINTGVNEIALLGNDLYVSSDVGILKSYTDKDNTLKFRKIKGINTQAFPIRTIRSEKGDYLLTGTLEGIFQITPGDDIISVEKECSGITDQQNYNVRKIVQSVKDPSVIYFGLQTGGILILKNKNNKWTYLNKIKNIPGLVYSLAEDIKGGLWFITDDPDALYRVKFSQNDTTIINYGHEKGMPSADLNTIGFVDGEVYITSSEGVFRYEEISDSFISDKSVTVGASEGKVSVNLYQDKEGDIWYSAFSGSHHEYLVNRNEPESKVYDGVLNILPDVPLMDILQIEGKTYFLKSKEIYVADKKHLKEYEKVPSPSFVNISLGVDSVIMNGVFYRTIGTNRRIPELRNMSAQIPEFPYYLNEISFKWTTPVFTEEMQTQYSYMLEGFEKNWSPWEGISFGYNMQAIYSGRQYTNLPFGHYTFRVRTRTMTGSTGEELSYEFIILRPWYATTVSFIGFAILTVLIVAGIIKAYTRKLKNENIRLEGIVAERTAVVVKQKEELESSIHYASRIQMALLPSESILADNIPDYFILFKPRDIVSGDFFWMTRKQDRLYVVAADCTGHGVPGAFMSLLGMSFLDEILDRDPGLRADRILSEMRLHVTESLKQTGDENESKDGMDMGLLVFDYARQQIEFSGAYNPCLRVRKLRADEYDPADPSSLAAEGIMTNGEYILETIVASKMPIGISSRMDQEYVFEVMPMEKNVSYYLFSDGYIDQFGGPNQRKFMKKGFKQMILEIQHLSMEQQKEILLRRLDEWKGDTPQIDDILVVGLRLE